VLVERKGEKPKKSLKHQSCAHRGQRRNKQSRKAVGGRQLSADEEEDEMRDLVVPPNRTTGRRGPRNQKNFGGPTKHSKTQNSLGGSKK